MGRSKPSDRSTTSGESKAPGEGRGAGDAAPETPAERKAKRPPAPRPSYDTRHQRFAEEYVVDFNGTQAAIRCGYTPAWAANNAYRLLRRPEIAAAVARAIEERRKSALITADRVLKEYARIAFADLRRVTKWGPEGVALKPDDALSDDDAAAIAELSHRTGRGTRIKLHDKRRALDSIARHLGLFTPQQAAADPKARHEAAARARETLARGIAALTERQAKGEE